jgi:hypothetical protein
LYIVVLYYTSVLYNTGVLCYTWFIAWIDSGHGGICDGWRKEGLGKVAGVNPGNDPGVTEDPSVIEDRGVIENNDVQIRVEKDHAWIDSGHLS